MKKILLNEPQLLFVKSLLYAIKENASRKDMSSEKIRYYQHKDEPNNVFIKTELISESKIEIGWFCLSEEASVYDLVERFPESEDLNWFTDQLNIVEIDNIKMSESKKLKLVRAYAKAWENKDFECLKNIITDKMKFYSQFSFYDFDTNVQYVDFLKEHIKPRLENCITETQIGYYNGDPCLVIVNLYKEAKPRNVFKIKKDSEDYSFEQKVSKRDSWVILFEFKDDKIFGISNCCVPTEEEVMAYSKHN